MHLSVALIQVWETLPLSSCRLVCVVPTAVAPPPRLYAANPPILYTIKQKLLHSQLQESFAPHTCEMHHLVARHLFCSPDRQLMQMDSGWLGSLPACCIYILCIQGKKTSIMATEFRHLEKLRRKQIGMCTLTVKLFLMRSYMHGCCCTLSQ